MNPSGLKPPDLIRLDDSTDRALRSLDRAIESVNRAIELLRELNDLLEQREEQRGN